MRRLLIPFSWLYGLALWLRNTLYDLGIFKSESFDVPVIVIGNLHAGGTGKSPLIAYTSTLLGQAWNPAVLSRGYGRSTRGFREVTETDKPALSGDEPLMLRQMLPNSQVFVCENRVEGIRTIRSQRPNRLPLLLDDAFQHRRLKAGLNVLLCPFESPWNTDHLLPAGHLREGISGLKRADLIVVTKSPPNLSQEASLRYSDTIRCSRDIPVLFSSIQYREQLTGLTKGVMSASELLKHHVLVFSGIADPLPLHRHIGSTCLKMESLVFPDHHPFSVADLIRIRRAFQSMSDPAVLLTTRKDAVRLMNPEAHQHLGDLPVYIIDMEMVFLFDGASQYAARLYGYLDRYR